jgi:hypothetical protein
LIACAFVSFSRNSQYDSGQSVGYSATAGFVGDDAVLWSPSGQATVLQNAPGFSQSAASAINDAGQSVGFSGGDAVLWSPSGEGDSASGCRRKGYSDAVAINDSGQSVGFSKTVNGQDAVLWSPSGKAIVLRNLSGGHYSDVYAINDAGQSVGYSGEDAVLWSPSGKATNLGNILGSAWSGTQAVGINNSGDIVGNGEYHGEMSAFLLMHVSGASPETFDAIISHTGSVSALAAHNQLDLSHRS